MGKKLPVTGIDFFLEKYPYLKIGNTGRDVVICPLSADLMMSSTTNPEGTAQLYRLLFPANYTYHIIGYEKNLSPETKLENTAADFVQIIQEKILGNSPENAKKIILVGISYGGFLASLIANKYPHLVEKLILLVSAGSVNAQGRQFVENLIALAKDGKGLELEKQNNNMFQTWWLRWLLQILSRLNWKKSQKDRYPLTTMINAYSDLIDRIGSSEELLRNIRVPTYILGGDQDRFFARECYEQTAALIPNAKLTLLHGGHMSPIEKHKEAAVWIKNALDGTL
jgi:pimeloyl-ACP methyl ester carboxylesterase